MADAPEFRVYLSSTLEDLVDERKAAREIISRHAIVLDTYRADDKRTVENCINDVRSAHLYVGIIGQRYGWVPDGEDQIDAKSITELEYDACRETGRPRIPRLIFVRTTNSTKFTDALNRPKTADRIKKFLDRASTDQMAVPFEKLEDFRVHLTEAVMKQRDAFHREKTPGPAILDSRRVWQSKLMPVVLLSIPGKDEIHYQRIISRRPTQFAHAELRPADADISWQVEQALRKGQLCCLLLTPDSLKSITDYNRLPRFAHALDIIKRRLGKACILWIGDDGHELQKLWPPVSVIPISPKDLEQTPETTVAKIYSDLQGQATLTTEPRLALSCLVIAPTREEVESLVNADGSGFSAYEDEALRKHMRKQLKHLADATKKINRAWPQDTYGISREEWRCFGPQSKTVADLIKDVVSTINAAGRGSREREVLQDAELIVRHYTLDEYLQDIEGSQRTVLSMRADGCLMVIDEIALFHPILRKAVNALLPSPVCAIVSVSPYDPAQMPTRQLFSESSFLRVGGIIDRFKTEQDPQCEIALNSEERVQRWLRTAIPRLIIDTDGSVGRPRLVAQADRLFV